jgi:hypothetical protein
VSKYVRDIVIKKQFEEDLVTVVLRPMKFGDALRFAELDTEKMSPKEVIPFMETMKGYVKTLSGLKTHDAADVTVDELFESTYFLDFLTDVLVEWLEKSTPSNPPSAGASRSEPQPA